MKYYEFNTVETYSETYMTDEEKAELINNTIKILKSDNIYRKGFKSIGVKQVNIKDNIKNIYYHQDGFIERYYVLRIELSSKNYLILQEKEHPQLFKLFNKRFNELWEQEQQEEQQQQGAEMKEEREKELIIKNAFEFLKRKDLIIVDGVITYPFLSKHMLKTNDVYGMCLEKYFNADTYIFIKYQSRLDLTLRIDLDKNKELTDLFTETYNKLKAQHEKAEQPQDDYYLRKHDKGKPKLLQVPVEAITAISEVMDYGSNKYSANTWQQVEVERYLQAGVRHIYAIQEKDEQGRITFNLGKKDEESNIEHIKHALCNLAYVVALYEMKKEK